ncbi:sensor [Rhodovulum sp. P5]|uniref:PAS-domain containing protein n=1 Tax=Rhodovulum sp. P5 TaxID=1564506 RepID=UPI0009C3765D|nr:PAS-domain containing protein [Rhodovulum sp. P5]ARE40584.1 sensor [Rhodovulum sp. P5]
MSLTRRFRGEIETGQAVIDSLDEAIAVFSTAGVLTLSNIAYAELWGDDPLLVLGTIDIAGATAQWQDQCVADTGHDPAELARNIRHRQAWSGELVHRDGRVLTCRIKPIAGGAMLIGFQPVAAGKRPPRAISGGRG